jgi:hypothetical protein
MSLLDGHDNGNASDAQPNAAPYRFFAAGFSPDS